MLKVFCTLVEGGAWTAVALNTSGWVSHMAWGFVVLFILNVGCHIGEASK